MGKKRMENFFVVVETNNGSISEEFDTLDEAKEYVGEEFDDDALEYVRVYEVVKSYAPKTSGVELEEVDL